jgi:hypothetical protein
MSSFPRDALCPLGSVLAWIKDFTGTPSLPVEWVECNGQLITDIRSPFYNASVPTLNGNQDSDKYFLRGSITSGSTGGTVFHRHSICWYGYTYFSGVSSAAVCACGCTDEVSHLPLYYEVVYILRIV